MFPMEPSLSDPLQNCQAVCSVPHRDVSGLGGGHHLEQEVREVGGVGQVHPAPHHTSSGPLV